MAGRRLRDRFDRLFGGVLAAEVQSAARDLQLSADCNWKIIKTHQMSKKDFEEEQ
jgi:hypothetical protein